MAAKLHCKVSPALDRVINEVWVMKSGKGKALQHLLDLAIADAKPATVTFVVDKNGTESATLTIGDSDFKETAAYRTFHLVPQKTEFFLHALTHGAALHAANPAAE